MLPIAVGQSGIQVQRSCRILIIGVPENRPYHACITPSLIDFTEIDIEAITGIGRRLTEHVLEHVADVT